MNYVSLVKSGVNYITRTPLIPVVIDNINNLNAIGEYLSSLGVKEIELLPYNKYAGSKYSWLLKEYDFEKQYIQKEEINHLELFLKYGIKARIM